jgi:glycosyltransferase involved in cell wall biosynthesis
MTQVKTPPSRPIKVMHIIARLNIGGAAIYVIQLTAQLQAMGYDSQLVCGQVGKDEGDMRYLADEKHLPLTIVPTLGREISLIGDIKTIVQLWQLMRREKPDIVHTHTAKAGLVGRIAARLAGVPAVVHTFHGHVFAGYFGKLKTSVFLSLERFCALLSTRIITLSTALKYELAHVFYVTSEKKIEVIELGFELNKLSAFKRGDTSFRQLGNIPLDMPLVGIVGRLVPIKNHELFLHAAKIVTDTLPNVHFAIVGDGERRTELEMLTRQLELERCVHFTGWIRDLTAVYAALDMLVLCSNNEGLPVSLIEAMAAGVPVISTAVGGAPDLLEQGQLGKLVAAGDAPALANAIIEQVNNPTAIKTIEHIRQAVISRYAIETSTSRTDSLYRQLLSTSTSRGQTS